jgi:hypothetical protein
MPEDKVVSQKAEIKLDFSKGIESAKELELEIAKLNAELAKLKAASLKGFDTPGIDESIQKLKQLRQIITSGGSLSEEQQKYLAGLRVQVDIDKQDLLVRQRASQAVADEAKTRQGLATFEAQLANQRAAAEDKAKEQVFLRIPALQAELASMQRTVASRGLESTELSKQINLERQKIDLLEKERSAGTEITAAMRAQTAEIEKNAAVLKSNLQTVTADTGATGQQGFWERRFGWFVAGASFYGSMRLIKEAFQNMADIESKMTVIKRVSNEATADFGQMQKELLDLSVQMGQSWDDTSRIAIMWSQAGYNMRDTLELTKVSLLAMNTAELNATEATSGLIAIMAQWDLQAQQLLPTLDKINLVADRYAVTSGDLISGLQRSSGAAKLLGMSLEETISLLTILREGSGRTGREVGNALNSILSFIQRPNTRKALEDAGIQVWADTAQTQMRNVMDILRDVSKSWNGMSEDIQKTLLDSSLAVTGFTEEIDALANATKTLTQAEQMELGQAMAGTYRRNYMNILLKDFAKSQDIVLQMEQALGYSLRENTQYLETYEAKVQQLKAAWVQASTSLAQSGLFNILKIAVDTGRTMLEVFNALPAPIRAATTALAAYGVALTVVSMIQKMFEKTAIATALTKIGTWMSGFITPAGALGVLVGGSALVSFVKQVIEANRQLNVMGDAYVKAKQKLEGLDKGTEEYNDAQETLQTVMNAIGDKFPHLIVKVDEYGNVTELAADATDRFKRSLDKIANPADEVRKKIIALKDEMMRLQQQLGISEYVDNSTRGVLPGDIAPTMPTPDAILLQRIEALKRQIAVLEGEAVEIASGKSGAAGSGLPFDAESWKSRMDSILSMNSSLELSMIEVQKNVRLTAIEEERLRDAMASVEEIEDAVAKKTSALAEENRVLSATNASLYAKLEMVYALQKEAQAVISDPASDEALEDARSAYEQAEAQIRSLTSEIANNTVRIRENEVEIERSGKVVQDYYKEMSESAKRSYDEIYSLSQKTFEHQSRMLNTSLDLQIRYYRKLYDLYKDDQEKRWDIEEKLQGLYKDGLEEQMDLVEKAYRQRLEWIDKETEAKVKALQEEIDRLDAVDEASQRSESARQHNEKLIELQKEWQYHDIRLGKDHEKAKAEIEKQIEEEKIRWQNQLRQWDLDDRREALQDRIKDVQEAAEKEKEALQKEWEATTEAFQNNLNAIISTAAVFQSSWYETGLAWGQQLAEGFRAGSISAIQSIMAQANSKSVSDASGILARSQALLDAKRQWEDAFARGDRAGMDAAAALGRTIRESGTTLDPNQTLTGDQLEALIRNYIPKAHTGAYVAESGVANLLKGELVLNPQLSVQFQRLNDILERNPVSSISHQTVMNFAKGLVNLERAELFDRLDLESLAELVFQRIQAIANSQGSVRLGAGIP